MRRRSGHKNIPLLPPAPRTPDLTLSLKRQRHRQQGAKSRDIHHSPEKGLTDILNDRSAPIDELRAAVVRTSDRVAKGNMCSSK